MARNNLEAFKSQLGSGARSNLFEVVFSPPTGVLNAGELVTYMVKTASLPGRTLGQIPVNWRGATAKLAGDPTYADWSVSFWNDVTLGAWKTMVSWQELVHQTLTNTSVNPALYKGMATVKQLDGLGMPVQAVQLIGCWPLDLGEVTLDTSAQDTIEEFTTQISFDYWVGIPI